MLLFENMHMAYHHKKDVVIISKMLSSCGLNVAILDIYNDDKSDNVDGIPILHLDIEGNLPKEPKMSKMPGVSMLNFISFIISKYRLLRHVLIETSTITKSYYVGSYGTTITSVFLRSNKPCFYWGLRSYFVDTKHFVFRNPFKAFIIWYHKTLFKKHNNYFFVSNNIIRSEYETLGIPEERLILRDERLVEKQDGNGYYNLLSSDFKYLVIGQLRPDKRVELTINAYKKLCSIYRTPTKRLLLVGVSSNEYEKKINTVINDNKSITRINRYLEDDFFYDCIKQANCLVFADKQMPHSITNGTFMEALINYRPVVVPNYPPYDYYIKKYNVGVMYDPKSEESFVNALYEIMKNGTKYYHNDISKFLKTIDFKTSSKKLTEDIKDII